MPFGSGTAWFCVRGTDVAAVAATLRLRTAVAANWASGLGGAADGLFVGRRGAFVVAVGRDAFASGEVDSIATALVALSAAHGAAWWFACDETNGHFGWARAQRGELRRGYWYDDSGAVDSACGDDPVAEAAGVGARWDTGAMDADEGELGFFVDDPRDRSDDPVKWWPTARDVLALAARWSFDPRQVPPQDGVGTGLLGRW